MALRHIEQIETARKEIELADHLIYVTFKMVNDVKFLLAVSQHIIAAAQNALEALLEYEKHYKRLESYHTSFAIEISTFRQKVESRHNIDSRFHKLLIKLLELQRFDQGSVVRFKRGEKYILASSEYNLSVLDLENIKRYLNLTKKFVGVVKDIVTKEVGIR